MHRRPARALAERARASDQLIDLEEQLTNTVVRLILTIRSQSAFSGFEKTHVGKTRQRRLPHARLNGSQTVEGSLPRVSGSK